MILIEEDFVEIVVIDSILRRRYVFFKFDIFVINFLFGVKFYDLIIFDWFVFG